MLKRLATSIATTLLIAASSPVSAAAAAPEKVKFVLDWFPAGYISFTHVGVKRGFFADEGLDVSIDIGRGGSDAVTRVATGTNDFGSASLSSMLGAAANATIGSKAVLSVYSKSPDSIITTEGSGINSIKDLKGKTLATATFSGSNVLWPIVAKNNGLDPETVKLTKVDTNALAPMLLTGKTDAVIAWLVNEPLYTALMPDNKTKLKVLRWSDYGLNGYNWSIMASPKVMKERPEVVRKFLRAYLKSIRFVMDNPDQAAADLTALAPDTKVETNAAEIRAIKPLIINELSEKYGLGKFEPSMVRQTWKWVADAQGFPIDKLDPESVVDRSFLP